MPLARLLEPKRNLGLGSQPPRLPVDFRAFEAVRLRIMAEPVYEMVWDCRYCTAKKLLGLTHRHCPNCGAQQDPNARYFPLDHEKVAVQNHEFVGADMQCRYCGGASSKSAHN